MGKFDGNLERAGGSNGSAMPGHARGDHAAHHARRLIAAANELLALAAELEGISGFVAHSAAGTPAQLWPDGDGDPTAPCQPDDEVRWLRCARRTYRNRRSRSAIFEDDSLFGEPAWDLLLDLFIAAKERKRVPVTSACIGAAVPTTTALRWLAVLEDKGHVIREADPNDARRIFVRLSADAYARMVKYFARTVVSDAEDAIDAAKLSNRQLERNRT